MTESACGGRVREGIRDLSWIVVRYIGYWWLELLSWTVWHFESVMVDADEDSRIAGALGTGKAVKP